MEARKLPDHIKAKIVQSIFELIKKKGVNEFLDCNPFISPEMGLIFDARDSPWVSVCDGYDSSMVNPYLRFDRFTLEDELYPYHNPTKWDNRYMEMARLVSTWSKDPSRKVGAVIVDNNNTVLSVGYNGPPKGFSDDAGVVLDRDKKLAVTIHAEMNAVLHCDRKYLDDCTIYVTLPPCSNCLVTLAQKKIGKIVTVEPDKEFSERWDFKGTLDLAEKLGVKICVTKGGLDA